MNKHSKNIHNVVLLFNFHTYFSVFLTVPFKDTNFFFPIFNMVRKWALNFFFETQSMDSLGQKVSFLHPLSNGISHFIKISSPEKNWQSCQSLSHLRLYYLTIFSNKVTYFDSSKFVLLSSDFLFSNIIRRRIIKI